MGVDFGSVQSFDPVKVTGRSLSSGCGTACTTACGTGDAAKVFYGATKGTYTYHGAVSMPNTLSDRTVHPTIPLRYVVVCRGGYGTTDDDIQVDSIWIGCP